MISRLFIYNWYDICLLINWYQDFCFSIGIVSLLIGINMQFIDTFLIGINMHFIDTFLIGIIFDLTPHWYRFCFRQKGGEHILLFWLFTPLLIHCFEQKGREKFIDLVLLFPFYWWLFLCIKKGEKILFCFDCLPFCWWLTKRGRIIWEFMHVWYMFYMHSYVFAYIKFNIEFNW